MSDVNVAAFSARLGKGVVTSVLLAVTGLSVVAAALIGNGNPIIAIAPLVCLIGAWAMWVAPLRVPLIALTFVCLSLDKPSDANGLWHSPLQPLGGLLLDNLNQTIHISALKISGMSLVIGYALVIRLWRFLSGTLEKPDLTKSSDLLFWGLGASFVSAMAVSAYGVVTGGDVQMIKVQLQMFLSLLVLAYLLAVSLRGVRDYKVLATVIVAAACIKAVMAVWINMTVLPTVSQASEIEYVTNHGDSMLFAVAVTIMVAALFEQPVRRNFHLMLLVLPILLAGMIANSRRLVWMQVLASLAVLLALNPRGRASRALLRSLAYGLPVMLLYVVIGWNSNARIFAPVQTVRTMTDAEVDRSTWFRDIENFNLLYTFNQHPILGTGFGHPFETAVTNYDISVFKEYPYLPHNSILGLWAFCGVFGFWGLTLAPVIGILLAARSYRFSRDPRERAAAATAIAAVTIYLIHCWGDIGFTEEKSILLVGASLAVSGQLALSTGAWRLPRAPATSISAHAA